MSTEGTGGSITVIDSTSDSNGFGAFARSANAIDDGELVLRIESSTISNSTSGVFGGLNGGARLTIINSTLSDNGSRFAGLEIVNASTAVDERAVVEILHTTITGHTIEDYPALQFTGPVSATVDHSVVSGNDTPFDLALERGADVTVRHSLIGTADAAATASMTGSTGVILGVIDPQLGPLADNGGLTLTHLPEASSPVVRAGDPAITGAPLTDQRGPGFDRMVGTIDLGPVETAAAAPAELAPTGTDSAVLTGGALMLLTAGLVLLLLRRRLA